MLTSSCKAKGRNLCKWLRVEILNIFGEIHPSDIKVTSSGSQGEDITLSNVARAVLPFQWEAKNLSKFAGYKFWDQASTHGIHVPIVIIKANHRNPLVIMDAVQFLQLCKEAYKGRKE